MHPNQCSHGKLWEEKCLECKVISLRETIKSFEPLVIRAKKRLQVIEAKLTEPKR